MGAPVVGQIASLEIGSAAEFTLVAPFILVCCNVALQLVSCDVGLVALRTHVAGVLLPEVVALDVVRETAAVVKCLLAI